MSTFVHINCVCYLPLESQLKVKKLRENHDKEVADLLSGK